MRARGIDETAHRRPNRAPQGEGGTVVYVAITGLRSTGDRSALGCGDRAHVSQRVAVFRR